MKNVKVRRGAEENGTLGIKVAGTRNLPFQRLLPRATQALRCCWVWVQMMCRPLIVVVYLGSFKVREIGSGG